MLKYLERLKVLSSEIYARTIANVWRKIRMEREGSKNAVRSLREAIKMANSEERKLPGIQRMPVREVIATV